MAALFPFRALRPAPDAAARVASVPYDVVTTEEARALATGNPCSFLHVSRAEIDLPAATDPYDPAVYAKALSNFQRIRREAPLIVEDRPSLYVYRLHMGRHAQTGLAGCYSIDEYEHDVIRKHERTRRDKEDDRTRHILALRAQTGPVLLTYRESAAIEAIVSRVVSLPPLFDFTAADGVRHVMWRVPTGEERGLVAAMDAIPTLYIADGHHRAASAARTREHLRAENGAAAGEWDRLLAVAFPDNQMQILAYNRVVKDLGPFSAGDLLEALGKRCRVESRGHVAPGRGEAAMYLDGRWYLLELPPPPADASAADALDVSRLETNVLRPLLGIGDVRTDKRIEFVGGARGTAALEALVASGEVAVAFAMHPVRVSDLMAIADAGGIMPPKSTWFEPKLRDGLLSHVF